MDEMPFFIISPTLLRYYAPIDAPFVIVIRGAVTRTVATKDVMPANTNSEPGLAAPAMSYCFRAFQ